MPRGVYIRKEGMEDIKAIYSLLVRCWKAGDMKSTIERLQAILTKEVKETQSYA